MENLKDFASFLNEAVSPQDQETLLHKGKQVTAIVSEIVDYQKKIADLYEKLQELMKGDETFAPMAKSIEVAADRAKEETKDAKEIEAKIEKAQKDYKPRPGSAADYLVKHFEDGAEMTEHEAQIFMQTKEGGDGIYGRGFNRATITSTLEFLVKRGILETERKMNPNSKRMATFYRIKK